MTDDEVERLRRAAEHALRVLRKAVDKGLTREQACQAHDTMLLLWLGEEQCDPNSP